MKAIVENIIRAAMILASCLAVYLRAHVFSLVWLWFVVASMPDMPTIAPKMMTGLLLIWETMRLLQPIERAAAHAKAFGKGEKREPALAPFKEKAMFDALLLAQRLINTANLLVSASILHLLLS